jgi:cell division inhibitor SulA
MGILSLMRMPSVICPWLLQILNLAEAAQAQMTKAAFDGSTHYVMVRRCRSTEAAGQQHKTPQDRGTAAAVRPP